MPFFVIPAQAGISGQEVTARLRETPALGFAEVYPERRRRRRRRAGVTS
jgi:hypothetical protein